MAPERWKKSRVVGKDQTVFHSSRVTLPDQRLGFHRLRRANADRVRCIRERSWRILCWASTSSVMPQRPGAPLLIVSALTTRET